MYYCKNNACNNLNDCQQVESELESVRIQLEEESEARLDIERQLVKANGEVQVWRSKYETEANARAEEVIEEKRY